MQIIWRKKYFNLKMYIKCIRYLFILENWKIYTVGMFEGAK